MSRPAMEVADILRAQGNQFLERYQSSFGYQQMKAFRAILRCRSAALGGHIVSIRARPYFRARLQGDELEAWTSQQSRQSAVAAAPPTLQQLWRHLSRAD